MKILMLVPYLPTITMSGGQTRWYNIIRHLADRHEITVYSLIKDESERRFIPELKKYCKKVKVFERPQKPWTLRNILLSVFGPFPLLIVRNWSPEERRALQRELKENEYDVIQAETFYVMPHLGKTETPTILVEQTMWHNVYKHHVMNEVPILLRPFYMQDVFKVRFWEKFYWRRIDRLFAVSKEDSIEMQRLVPGREVGVIPNGVDGNYYAQKKIDRKMPPRVMYGVTNFEWLQNQEATKILIEEVWPGIKKAHPKAKVWIVGRKMPKWLKVLANKSDDIEITENISDARDAYRRASVMVAPIKGSGGTRLKILEAMAAGLPVVTTPVGEAGLRLKDGLNVMIGDTANELSNKTIELLDDSTLARKVGENGRKYVQKHFDWKAIAEMHDPVYRDVTSIRKS